MLEKASSCVLVSLQASTYRKEYGLGFSLIAALLEDLFEHPGGTPGAFRAFTDSAHSGT